MKTTGYTTQPRPWNRLIALGTALIFSWSLCISPVMAETIDLEGGSIDVTVQDNTTNWSVTGNPVWTVPEFNVAEGSIYNIAGLGSGSSLALLVNGGQASNIFGTMNLTNLDFILQNIAGINIGSSAMINLNSASLIASTLPLNLSVTDFLKQNYQFEGPGGFLTNDGKIIGNNADLVALVANAIENRGTIEVPMGTVALAAGNTVTVGISPDGLVSIGVDEATANTLGLSDQVKNTGTITADGGRVILNAKAIDGLFDKAINLSAEPNAVSVVRSDDGVIEFVAQGDILNQGTLQAECGSITIAAGTGEVVNEGTLKAGTLYESGYTFRSSGYLGVADAHFDNLDGYAFLNGIIDAGTYNDLNFTFDGDTVFEGAVTLNSLGDIQVYGDITITLGGSTVFNADSNADGEGGIYLQGASIEGAGYDLVLYGSYDDMYFASISNVDLLTLGTNILVGGDIRFHSSSNDDIHVDTIKTMNGVSFFKTVGTGADADHARLIYDVTQLQAMQDNLGYYYKLANNIDASETVYWNEGAGFNPVGNSSLQFGGGLDGDSYVISGLAVQRPSQNYAGLFGYILAAKIQNVGLINAIVRGNTYTGGLIGRSGNSIIGNTSFGGEVQGGFYTGGLVGQNDGTNIQTSHSQADVTGTSFVGGLVGRNSSSLIEGCYSTGSSAGNNYIGGLIGANYSSTLTNSYSSTVGSIRGESKVGGLIGYTYNSDITNVYSYSAGGVIGNSDVGGLIGRNLASTITNSYYDSQVAGRNDNDGRGIPKTTDEMMQQPTFLGWDFDVSGASAGDTGTWIMAGLPHLQMEWTTNIETAEQLQMMALDLDADYILTNNIDASATLAWNPFGTNQYNGFMPIGSESAAFTGSFDGQGNTISSLYVNNSGDIGLFGYTSGATLKNVTLSEFLIRSRPSLGSLGVLAGHIVDTTVEDVVVDQSQITISSPAPRLGGDAYLIVDLASGIPLPDEDLNLSEVHGTGLLVGRASEGSAISGSSSSGMINRNWDVVGGLVGFLGDSTVTDSSSAANVAGRAFVGGLVGISWDSVIENGSHATGTVGGAQAVGGLVGAVLGGISRLSDVYATGDVTSHDITSVFMGGPAASFLTGGLVGYSKGTDTEHRVVIQDSYATGIVTATTGISVGGFAGGTYYTEITDSYATGNVEGYHSVGGFVGRTDLDSYIAGSALAETTKASGTVTGVDKSESERSEAVGGFVGWHTNSTIEFSHARGDVTGYNGVGGFTGMNNAGFVYDSSALEGFVDGAIGVGGFIGVNNSGTYARNIWDETLNAHLLPIGGSVTGQNGAVYTYTVAVDRTLSEWNEWTGQYFEPPVPVQDPGLEEDLNRQYDELNPRSIDGLVLPEVELPNPLAKFVTDVFVREGSVYVLDGTNDSSLLTQGESVRVNFKKMTAAAAEKAPGTGSAEPVLEPAITTGGNQPVESISKPFIGWAKPVAPVITDLASNGNRYGVLKKPDSNVFVRARGSETWQSARDGMVILPGDEVRTADSASVKIALDEGKVGTVEIKGGSLFRINKAETDPETGDKTTLLDLAIGKALVHAGKLQGASKFEVRTPTALTGVRGTIFEVTVKEKA